MRHCGLLSSVVECSCGMLSLVLLPASLCVSGQFHLATYTDTQKSVFNGFHSVTYNVANVLHSAGIYTSVILTYVIINHISINLRFLAIYSTLCHHGPTGHC